MSFYTKGNVHQTLPVTPEIAAAFAALPAGANPNTPVVNILRAGNLPGNRPGPRPRFTKQWKALKQRTGIRPELRVHDLRRTVAEDVWQATHDLRAVQHQLGHRSITTTAKYLAQNLTAEELNQTLIKVAQLRAARASKDEHERQRQVEAMLRANGGPFQA